MPRPPAQPAKRGRPSKSTQPASTTAAFTKRKAAAPAQPRKKTTGPFELSDSDAAPASRAVEDEEQEEEEEEEEEEQEGPENTIPPELLTRLLHEFFEKDDTRLSKDANAAAGKYMDVFVREAIARCVHERPGGFLEVEDLEKIAPQLLMDF
ncbi:Centromere protein X [Colletotrichum sp. SAR 10_70]|nr:Centromere protein X [Colletotrichum sp. SAR 10_71]KAI8194838.1 Centromere protein X [Colletotrichum sp. SAR 10_70]KAI8256010.1 Centromere protein X [Colletotrichum sp. SAR 10_77]